MLAPPDCLTDTDDIDNYLLDGVLLLYNKRRYFTSVNLNFILPTVIAGHILFLTLLMQGLRGTALFVFLS